MKIIVLVCILLFALSTCVLAASSSGFIPGPGGALFHPDCHVELPVGASMIDEERIKLEDGTIVPIPACEHQATENSFQEPAAHYEEVSIPDEAESAQSESAQSRRRENSTRMNTRTADGWNVYSQYYTGQYWGDFNGGWTVPNNPPAGYTGQLVYMFTALENYPVTQILQPVIWYGNSPAGGGAGWFMACWYVYNNNNNYLTSPVVQIQSGQYVSTYMHQVAANSWTCGMSAGGRSSSGSFPAPAQLFAFCTLEVYNVPDCNKLPPVATTVFSNLAISTGGSYVGFDNTRWTYVVNQHDCSQSISCNGNTCYMGFGSPYACPTNLGTDTLVGGQGFASNGVNFLVSVGCSYRLAMQGDGNLVLYSALSQPLWYTATTGVGPYRAIMQTDGNFVVYDSRNIALWYSHTNGKGVPPYRLVMQQDGNLVVYDSQRALWSRITGLLV